ncbi:MAG: leucyl/phenylalanyl-tRNA--protein transferase [Acidobacteriota bacterium]
MSALSFPDPRIHDFPEWVLFGDYYYWSSDIIAFGGELSPERLRDAYQNGIFPWYIEGMPLPWFCPGRRAILRFIKLRVARSLQKVRNKGEFTFTIDKNFLGVIENCSKMRRPGQKGTWITPEFIKAYHALYEMGVAHSVEAWNVDGSLAGGLYGVDAGGVFCGESMFFLKPNASKLCLLYLIDHLTSRGATWLDAQVMTPHMQALGTREISRNKFLKMLEESQSLDLKLFP